jgi:hypothetical protein
VVVLGSEYPLFFIVDSCHDIASGKEILIMGSSSQWLRTPPIPLGS